MFRRVASLKNRHQPCPLPDPMSNTGAAHDDSMMGGGIRVFALYFARRR
jgi:hypothetical protein